MDASGARRAECMPARCGSVRDRASSKRFPVGTEHPMRCQCLASTEIHRHYYVTLLSSSALGELLLLVLTKAQRSLKSARRTSARQNPRQVLPKSNLGAHTSSPLPVPSRGRRREAGHLFRPVRPRGAVATPKKMAIPNTPPSQSRTSASWALRKRTSKQRRGE